MQYYVGYIDGKPFNKRVFKTLKGAQNHRHNLTPIGNPLLKIFRRTEDGIERYWGREGGHDQWVTVDIAKAVERAIDINSPEFATSPVAQANAASWDQALTRPETHGPDGQRLDPDTPQE